MSWNAIEFLRYIAFLAAADWTVICIICKGVEGAWTYLVSRVIRSYIHILKVFVFLATGSTLVSLMERIFVLCLHLKLLNHEFFCWVTSLLLCDLTEAYELTCLVDRVSFNSRWSILEITALSRTFMTLVKELICLVNRISFYSHWPWLEITVCSWTFTTLIKALEIGSHSCYSQTLTLTFERLWLFKFSGRFRVFINFLSQPRPYRPFHDSKYVLSISFWMVLYHNIHHFLKFVMNWR